MGKKKKDKAKKPSTVNVAAVKSGAEAAHSTPDAESSVNVNNNAMPVADTIEDPLYWKILDAANEGFKIPDYEKFRERYKTQPYGYRQFLNEDKILNYIHRMLAITNGKHDQQGALLIIEKIGKAIEQMDIVFIQQTEKVSLNKHLINFIADVLLMYTYITGHLFAMYKNFYDEEMSAHLNNTDRTQKPNYDFYGLQDYFKKALDFYLHFEKHFNNTFTGRFAGPKTLANHLLHSGIFQMSLSDLRSHPVDALIAQVIENAQLTKKIADDVMVYWGLTTAYSFIPGKLQITKNYYHKYRQAFLPIAKEYEQIKSLFGIAAALGESLYRQTKKETHPAIKLEYLSEAQFYVNESLYYLLLACDADLETFKRQLGTMAVAAKAKLDKINSKIYQLKLAALQQLNPELLSVSSAADLQLVTLKFHLPKEANIDLIQVFLKALYRKGISAKIDTENPSQIILSDLLIVPITAFADILSDWQFYLPKMPNAPQRRTQLKYSEANIPQYPTEEEKSVTKTQMLKSKGASIPAEPSIREQITEAMKNRKLKQPKKIVFPETDDFPSYTYDPNDPDCNVVRLEGDNVKDQYLCVDEDLLAYLAENNPTLLAGFINVFKNRIVRNNSKGHSCFVVNGSGFLELEAGGVKKIFNDAVHKKQNANTATSENTTNNSNNNSVSQTENTTIDNGTNNQNNNESSKEKLLQVVPITDKNRLHIKCKLFRMQGRLFGSTICIGEKKTGDDKAKQYHLLKMYIAKEKKDTKKGM